MCHQIPSNAKILVVLTVLCNSYPQKYLPLLIIVMELRKNPRKEAHRTTENRGVGFSQEWQTMLILRGVPLTEGFRTGPALWQSTHTHTPGKRSRTYVTVS